MPGFGFSRFAICCLPLLSSRICNSALSAACGHKHPSQAGRACSWMIWPSGGGALSVAVYDWIFTLLLVLRFNRFCLFQQICNMLPCFCLGWFTISHALRYRALAICCLDAATANSASGSRNHRAALYCRQAFLIAAVRKSASEVPLRFIDAAHRPLTAADG